MRGLSGRVTALETNGGGELSLSLRAWLGHPLTAAENAQATIEAGRAVPDPDWSKVSKEMREWLLA